MFQAMREAGFGRTVVQATISNPMITINRQRGRLFSLTENMDTPDAILALRNAARASKLWPSPE